MAYYEKREDRRAEIQDCRSTAMDYFSFNEGHSDPRARDAALRQRLEECDRRARQRIPPRTTIANDPER